MYGDSPASGITVRVPNPPKAASLRMPTNEEVLARLSQQRTIRRSLGRRKAQTEYVPNRKADVDLFNKIRLDKEGPEFDEFEASNAIAKLIYCEVIGCERDGDLYVITLKTPFGNTVHHVKPGTLRDITLYQRSVVAATELPHNQEEVRFRIEPAIDLYRAVVVSIEGYAESIRPGDVPPHHMQAVVVELIASMEDLDPMLDPNS